MNGYPEKEKSPRKEVFKPSKIFIDLDRTLIDVDRAMERLYSILESMGLKPEAVKAKRTEIEAQKQSFEPISVIRDLFPSLDLNTLKTNYANYNQIDIMFSDSREFLQELDTLGIEYEILTYGSSPEWQKMKIDAIGYTGTYKVIADNNKTAIFANSQNIWLIDDKRECLQEMPDGCRGFWLIRDKDARDRIQNIDVPKNVKIVSSLKEVIDILKLA